MKTPLPFLALAVVLLCCPTRGAAAETILGEWVGLERSNDGLGLAKTYAKDGTVQASYGALLDYRYNLAGKKLVLSAPPQAATVFYVELKGATLVLADLAGNRRKLTRISGATKAGIIGKWTGEHLSGRKQIMHFTEARNCYVSVPIQTKKGTYSIKGDILTENFTGKKPAKLQWHIVNDALTITSPSKDRAEIYRRKE